MPVYYSSAKYSQAIPVYTPAQLTASQTSFGVPLDSIKAAYRPIMKVYKSLFDLLLPYLDKNKAILPYESAYFTYIEADGINWPKIYSLYDIKDDAEAYSAYFPAIQASLSSAFDIFEYGAREPIDKMCALLQSFPWATLGFSLEFIVRKNWEDYLPEKITTTLEVDYEEVTDQEFEDFREAFSSAFLSAPKNMDEEEPTTIAFKATDELIPLQKVLNNVVGLTLLIDAYSSNISMVRRPPIPTALISRFVSKLNVVIDDFKKTTAMNNNHFIFLGDEVSRFNEEEDVLYYREWLASYSKYTHLLGILFERNARQLLELATGTLVHNPFLTKIVEI